MIHRTGGLVVSAGLLIALAAIGFWSMLRDITRIKRDYWRRRQDKDWGFAIRLAASSK
jgi:hypothetical protein